MCDKDIIYVGWIPTCFGDKEYILGLGVTGGMVYHNTETAYGVGAYAYCEATDEVMLRLIHAGLPNPGSFTAVNVDTRKQLPREQQKYWSWPTEVRNGVMYAIVDATCDE